MVDGKVILILIIDEQFFWKCKFSEIKKGDIDDRYILTHPIFGLPLYNWYKQNKTASEAKFWRIKGKNIAIGQKIRGPIV